MISVMDHTERVQPSALADWDWRAALRAHPIGKYGGLAWLADTLDVPRRTVYAWSAGQRGIPEHRLRDVARVLDHEGSSDAADCRSSEHDPEVIPHLIGTDGSAP